MHKRSTAALFCGISVMALATSALAQAANTAGSVESVVVTATRIQTNGYSAPTPVTVAPVAQLEATTPTTIADALNKLPQFSGSTTATGNSSTGGLSTVYTGAFLNLRSMGAVRTLILLDGRRVPATSVSGATDVNALPQMLVQRVDVVTGGASAVYGSDAVTGVVNYILDARMKGLKMEVQTGISDRGDVPMSRIGIAGGTDVFDRGHIIFSAEHYQNAGLKRSGDRSFTAATYGLVGAGTAASPYVLAQNLRIGTSSNSGLATSGPFAGQQFSGPNGTLAPFNVGTPTQSAGTSIGGDGSYVYDASIGNSSRYDQLFGRFEYQFSPDVLGFMQLGFSESGTSNYARNNQPESVLTIFSGNAYLPTSAQAALTAGNVASFTMSRGLRDLTNVENLFQTNDALNFTTGLKGSLLNNFKWETYYTHGESRIRSRRVDNLNYTRLYAAIDAVKDPNGNIVCRVTLTNPGAFPGCQPINLFGQFNESQAALNYIYQNTNFQILNKLDNYAATISGDVLQAWAGPLSVAANFEYRRQSVAQASTAIPADAATITALLTGVRFGKAPTTLWSQDSVGPQYGHNQVWEVSGEAALPLLVDQPFVKRLDVSGAVRYTNYSSSGAVQTWKAGLNYQPFEDLRFRYVESRDIRAPTLSDLYSGQVVQLLSLTDSHTGVSRASTGITSGNPNLVPEVARTTTIGAVYRPSFIPRFQASIDYYNITINNAIANVNGATASVQAECEASGGTSNLCSLLVRPLPFSDHSAANFPLYVIGTNLNTAQAYTHGVDVEVSYNFGLEAINLPGRVDLRLLYSYQPVLKNRTLPSSPAINTGGTPGTPSDRATLLAGYNAGPFSVSWQTRYSGPVQQSRNPLVVYAANDLPSYTLNDLSLGYRFAVAGAKLQANFAINNLFDKQPRIAPPTAATGAPGGFPPAATGDDMIGRYYTFTLKAQY